MLFLLWESQSGYRRFNNKGTLKATGKAMGAGLKGIGSKVGSLLPGRIGSIVSFVFKTAGQATSYLAEHTWLLILTAVAFVVKIRQEAALTYSKAATPTIPTMTVV